VLYTLPAGQLQVIILHDREVGEESGGGQHLSSTVDRGQQQQQQHIHALDYFLRLRTGELKKLAFPKRPEHVGPAAVTTRCMYILPVGQQLPATAAALAIYACMQAPHRDAVEP
jgi:hypothetical protein